MDVFTLYAGQGALAAVRSGDEAVIIDAHMPECEEVCQDQIEQSLAHYLEKSNVRGLILTGLDKDHACPAGVESILKTYEPDWVMYSTYYKDTETATEVFGIIARQVARREKTSRPLTRRSVRVDKVETRFLSGLANHFTFELFSPHLDDMDSSNNSSIVLKLTGDGPSAFSYLITGDTETAGWDAINKSFGNSLSSEVMAASHHGSRTGVNAKTLLLVSPKVVLISAGVDNSYEHPDGVAVPAYRQVGAQVFATNADKEGTCFLTRKVNGKFDTRAVGHFARRAANAQA
jgi:competence protein ComEC